MLSYIILYYVIIDSWTLPFRLAVFLIAWCLTSERKHSAGWFPALAVFTQSNGELDVAGADALNPPCLS